jgi:hypothetical protein
LVSLPNHKHRSNTSAYFVDHLLKSYISAFSVVFS